MVSLYTAPRKRAKGRLFIEERTEKRVREGFPLHTAAVYNEDVFGELAYQIVCKACRKSDIARLAIMLSFAFPFPIFAKKEKRL